jgi:hypothetical protein
MGVQFTVLVIDYKFIFTVCQQMAIKGLEEWVTFCTINPKDWFLIPKGTWSLQSIESTNDYL